MASVPKFEEGPSTFRMFRVTLSECMCESRAHGVSAMSEVVAERRRRELACGDVVLRQFEDTAQTVDDLPRLEPTVRARRLDLDESVRSDSVQWIEASVTATPEPFVAGLAMFAFAARVQR